MALDSDANLLPLRYGVLEMLYKTAEKTYINSKTQNDPRNLSPQTPATANCNSPTHFIMWSQTPERAPPRTTGPRLDEQSAPMNPPAPPTAGFIFLNALKLTIRSPTTFQVQCNPCHGLRTHVRLHLLLKLVAPLMQQSCSWVVLMLTWRRHSIARTQKPVPKPCRMPPQVPPGASLLTPATS